VQAEVHAPPEVESNPTEIQQSEQSNHIQTFLPVNTSKRTLSDTQTTPEVDKNEAFFVKPKKPKNRQQNTPMNFEELLKPTKDLVANESYALTYNQLVNLFDDTLNNPNTLSIAKRYNVDINEIIKMLTLIYPSIENKAMKSRCTLIRNRLSKQLLRESDIAITSDSDSDISQKK